MTHDELPALPEPDICKGYPRIMDKAPHNYYAEEKLRAYGLECAGVWRPMDCVPQEVGARVLVAQHDAVFIAKRSSWGWSISESVFVRSDADFIGWQPLPAPPVVGDET